MLNELLNPSKLWSRDEIFSKPCPIPHRPGVYAWYFKTVPPLVPVENCITWHGMTLLYIGISPSEPKPGSDKISHQTIYQRIRNHYRGNAYGSTLRLTLGCLLMKQLGLQPQRSGSSKRITFGNSENVLSLWMAENAFVTWMVVDQPWNVEKRLINSVNLPLNLQGNQNHPFFPVLAAIRRKTKGDLQ